MSAIRTIPLWAANRGIRLMVRAALAQEHLEPVPVEDLSALRRAVDDHPVAVLAASEDLRLAGIDVSALVHAVGEGPAVVILSTSRQSPNPQGTRARFVSVPFTSRDLLDALRGAHGHSTRDAVAPQGDARVAVAPDRPAAGPGFADMDRLKDWIAMEIERQVTVLVRARLDEMAQRIVPEMAETLIKQELARLVTEAEASAPLDLGPDADPG